MSKAKGLLFIVSAPSGAGKSSLNKVLLSRDSELRLSVSFTTRQPRVGEVDGIDYNFITQKDFENRVAKGEFLEHAYVHGNYYGTNKPWLEAELEAGHDIVLEIDWQGAQQVKKVFPEAIGIFILPPSMQILSSRLRGRGTDAEDVIQRRLDGAAVEIAQAHNFEYVVINDNFEQACNELASIVCAARLTFSIQQARKRSVFSTFGL